MEVTSHSEFHFNYTTFKKNHHKIATCNLKDWCLWIAFSHGQRDWHVFILYQVLFIFIKTEGDPMKCGMVKNHTSRVCSFILLVSRGLHVWTDGITSRSAPLVPLKPEPVSPTSWVNCVGILCFCGSLCCWLSEMIQHRLSVVKAEKKTQPFAIVAFWE